MIERLLVTAVELGDTCAGVNTQDIVGSSPVQLKVMVLVKLPPDGVSVTVNVAELPAETVALLLESV